LTDETNKNKEKPEKNSKKIKEEKIEETQEKTEGQSEKIEEEPTEPTEETIESEKTEEIKEELPTEEKPPVEEKPVKTKEKTPPKKEEKKKHDKDPDFKYIVRLSNTDINGEKNILHGLTTIKGIGLHISTLITDEAKIDRNMKIGKLKDAQIEKLQQTIDNFQKNAPSWMLNHRKDTETGKDIHLIGSEIEMRLRDEVNIMKKIRSYRGIRHERGLPVRGQRTRANNRKGLALGVSKKREQPQSKG
jgi:small subunit ribosomal protein S13